MLPYWLLFAMWTAGAIQFARRGQGARGDTFYIAAAVVTALMVGLRFEVGGDWLAYLIIYNDIYFQPLTEALRLSDPGYAFLNWMGAQAGWGVWVANLGCAALFTAGLARLASRQPNPWLAVLVAVPYLVIVVAMGYTRQAAAIGVICWAVADASANKLARLVGLIALATLFHKTAILFLPILLVPVVTRNVLVGAAGAIAFALIFAFFLGSESDRLVSTYVAGSYDSQGAAVRVAMNVLAGASLLMLRERMGFDPFIKSFWTICALLSLVSVVALVALPSSAGVDRLSLFLVPLQVTAFSRVPYALTRDGRPLPSALLGVIGYSFAVQFVWLNYAANASAWLPYRTTLFAAG